VSWGGKRLSLFGSFPAVCPGSIINIGLGGRMMNSDGFPLLREELFRAG
jgi:hypothetical protein